MLDLRASQHRGSSCRNGDRAAKLGHTARDDSMPAVLRKLSTVVTAQPYGAASVTTMLIALSILIALGVFYSGQTEFA
jgi:hypothetical protein